MSNHGELTQDGILARCQCGAPIFLEEVLAALRPGGFVTYIPVRIGEQTLFLRETCFNPKTMKLCLPLDRLPAAEPLS